MKHCKDSTSTLLMVKMSYYITDCDLWTNSHLNKFHDMNTCQHLWILEYESIKFNSLKLRFIKRYLHNIPRNHLNFYT